MLWGGAEADAFRAPPRFPGQPMPLLLTPKADDGALSIDLVGIVPERLAGLATAAIERLPVAADGRPTSLGELFRIEGDAADGVIECRGDFSRIHRVGAAMRTGAIMVSGSVGRHAAEGMAGGSLTVHGDAGDWLAAGMLGGQVLVTGRAGDNAAAAAPGERIGMRGGVVVIRGDCGCLAGARMRRGLLGIGGSCGEAAAFELRAGTVLVAGAVGRRSGMGMGRGSLIALASTPPIPDTFAKGSAWSPTFVPLLAARLVRAGLPAPGPGRLRGPWQQWHGDLLAGGRGEILHPAAAAGAAGPDGGRGDRAAAQTR